MKYLFHSLTELLELSSGSAIYMANPNFLK